MQTGNEQCFRFQGELIRQIQVKHGENPCFGMPSAENCSSKKESECLWSADCHYEAAAADAGGES